MSMFTSRRLLVSVGAILALLTMVIAQMFYFHVTPTSTAGIWSEALVGSASTWVHSPSVHLVRHHAGGDSMTVGVLLKTSDLAGQQALIKSLYHANSASYHQWLSAARFNAHFAPPASEVQAVQKYLTSAGLSLVASPAAALILAKGTVSQIEKAFQTNISDFSTSRGTYYGATMDVKLPLSISRSVLTVAGLSDLPVAQPHALIGNSAKPNAVPPYGGGPFGSGLTPSQIAGIYDTNPIYQAGNLGQGVTLAVFELSGYRSSDIVTYENHYHLPHMKIVNIPVLGGATNDVGAGEVELDIELQIAMAPKAKQLLVYESPNTELGALAQYLQIAQDNKADSISTSWGIVCEFSVNSQISLAENQIFLQMATQGQSIFAASGDSGAYGCSRLGFLPPTGQELQLGDPNN